MCGRTKVYWIFSGKFGCRMNDMFLFLPKIILYEKAIHCIRIIFSYDAACWG